jgi:hypothetical protein
MQTTAGQFGARKSPTGRLGAPVEEPYGACENCYIPNRSPQGMYLYCRGNADYADPL